MSMHVRIEDPDGGSLILRRARAGFTTSAVLFKGDLLVFRGPQGSYGATIDHFEHEYAPPGGKIAPNSIAICFATLTSLDLDMLQSLGFEPS